MHTRTVRSSTEDETNLNYAHLGKQRMIVECAFVYYVKYLNTIPKWNQHDSSNLFLSIIKINVVGDHDSYCGILCKMHNNIDH